MVKAIRGLTSAKRFGARYGRRIKELFENAEKTQRQFHKCPYCHAIKVKRLASGIWSCRKCCATFTGKAYIPFEKVKLQLLNEEQVPSEKDEESQADPTEAIGEE